jgi:hypothetical protein
MAFALSGDSIGAPQPEPSWSRFYLRSQPLHTHGFDDLIGRSQQVQVRNGSLETAVRDWCQWHRPQLRMFNLRTIG